MINCVIIQKDLDQLKAQDSTGKAEVLDTAIHQMATDDRDMRQVCSQESLEELASQSDID